MRGRGRGVGAAASTVPAHYCPPGALPPPPRGRFVEYCHQTIRSQAADHFGGHVGVRFDSPETYFVSSALEGVRGGALVAGGGARERIQYGCTVNIRRGLVTEARFRYR